MNFRVDIDRQREFLQSGQTKEYGFRRTALLNLRKAIKDHYTDIVSALEQDLHKSEFESYLTEINVVIEEINYMLRNLRSMMRPRRPSTPLLLFPSRSQIVKEPYGLVLIIAPWNYPFQLTMSPLVGAIAAGNCAVLKPSTLAPATADIMQKIIDKTFNPSYITLINGENAHTVSLLNECFDYIFYTGGVSFGREVMRAAAEHLTPVTLELGGKSPCIVDCDADISVTARRIVWGKFLNCGQTCVAPDYILAHSDVKQRLVDAIIKEIKRQYGDNPQTGCDYPRIISQTHTQRLQALIEQNRVIYGGVCDMADKYVSPTLIDNPNIDNSIMQDEIFGPLLPIIEFSDLDQAIKFVNDREKPLALYYFSRSTTKAKLVINRTTSGGACINDVVVHVANLNIPFGGVGNSGMGAYHGKYSFDTFSHHRSVVSTSTKINFSFKFAPFKQKINLLRLKGGIR